MRGIAMFTVHGRVANDPFLDTLQNGTERCRAYVVANIPKMNREKEEWEYDDVWFTVAWFGRAAGISKRLRKGMPIVIHGEIRSWQEEHGEKKITRYNFRPTVTSLVDEEERLRRRAERETEPESYASRRSQPQSTPPTSAAPSTPPPSVPPPNEMFGGDPFGDEDLPF